MGVELLEMVDVHHDHREQGLAAPGYLFQNIQLCFEEAAVVDAGQAILRHEQGHVFGDVLQRAVLAEQLLLRHDPAGHVLLDANVVGRRAVAAEDGRKAQLVPEHGAIAPVIAKRHQAVLPRRDGGADDRDPRLVAVFPLKIPAIDVGDVFERKARHALECRVDEDQGIAPVPQLGNGDAVAGIHHGLFQDIQIHGAGSARGGGRGGRRRAGVRSTGATPAARQKPMPAGCSVRAIGPARTLPWNSRPVPPLAPPRQCSPGYGRGSSGTGISRVNTVWPGRER